MGSFSIRDLFIMTLVVAGHFALSRLLVGSPSSWIEPLCPLVVLTPTALTIWIHRRTGASWFKAIPIHYFVTVTWATVFAFIYSWTKSLYWPIEQPVNQALLRAGACLLLSAVVGAITSLYYGLFAYLFSAWYGRRPEADRMSLRDAKQPESEDY